MIIANSYSGKFLFTDAKIPNSDSSPSLHSAPAVLYVWAGQNTSVKNAADFVAVVDFDEKSGTYGHILKTVPLVSDTFAGIKQTGNEPHHSSISADGCYYITGGLLSFLTGHKEVFVWRIPKNPTAGPKFLYALDVPGACTDEFLPIDDANFIVSMMCNDRAISPGDIAFINARTRFTKSFLKNASRLHGFNPHGYGRLNNGSLFVGDYTEPLSLVGTDPSRIVFRNTVRHFLPDGRLERIFHVPFPTDPESSSGIGHGIGFMEVKTIPHDPLGRSYTCGTSVNKMYLIGPGMAKPLFVLDLSQVNGFRRRASAGIASMFPDGKRMLATFQMRFILLLNITQPEHPQIIRVFDFCSDKALDHVPIRVPDSHKTTTFARFCAQNNNLTGTHVLIHPKGENRFIVINYFLKFGMA
ncbi:unnamed protein product [Didymodactylos carnosus]|uniref:Uncharacterized protein n=1 Tax=Didymodactylos carnosus TaxID=1234261 RepID=A0A815CWD7_9BILA|nr:unnamed protein product [Didymodactylos carnosus]CAF4094208.1 unnamed protein product [Didymodactylos carnosus]